MMSKEQFEQLISKLDALIKVTAASAFTGRTKDESILILSEMGFGNTEIATILGTSAAYVGNVKHKAKKAGAGKKKEFEDKGVEKPIEVDEKKGGS